MLRKLLSTMMLIAVFVTTAAAAPVSRAGANGLVSLWSIKPEGSSKTIGELWFYMKPYSYTCKSEWIKFAPDYSPDQSLKYKLIYWPNFYSGGTLVSRDTYCWPTNSAGSWIIQSKLLTDLYREIGSSNSEPFLDMVYAFQIKGFSLDNPNLVCKSAGLGVFENHGMGWLSVRYNKVIFKPSKVDQMVVGFLFATRDLTCTTKISTINNWKRNRYWSVVSWFK
jgi:hypothetical protein